jgi:hypothetical protein
MRSAVLPCLGIAVVATVVGCGDVCDGEDVLESASITVPSDLEDLQGIKCVLGNLKIGPTDESLDLSPLADLEIIEGALTITNAHAVSSLNLPLLRWVGRRGINRESPGRRGDLRIARNLGLTSLELPSLTDVGGCFFVFNNESLAVEVIDKMFLRVRSHAIPGSCFGRATEEQSGNLSDPFDSEFSESSGGI